MKRLKYAPRNCPVCGEILALTRLSCDECGTELAGHFPTCEYCSLSPEERDTLKVFLSSRGNMKDLERHLNVSYPTARARFDAILTKLGIEAGGDQDPPEESPSNSESTEGPERMDVLEALARGELNVDEALKRIT